MGGFSIWHWVIVLVVVILVFGTRKLGNMGKDVGSAIRGFKEGMKGDEQPGTTKDITPKTIDQTGSDRR